MASSPELVSTKEKEEESACISSTKKKEGEAPERDEIDAAEAVVDTVTRALAKTSPPVLNLCMLLHIVHHGQQH